MTISRFAVGTPRFRSRPPRAAPPCSNPPAVTGSNVLQDPGFEFQLANYGVGEGAEIPGVSLGNGAPYQWVDATEMGIRTHWLNGYRTASFIGTDRYWKVSTVNPDAGTYHARIAMGATGPNNSGLNLMAGQYTQCDWVPPTASTPLDFMTAMVEPGMFVKLSARLEASVLTDAPEVQMYVQGFTAAFLSGTLFATNDVVLGTSYATAEVSAFIPAGDFVVLCGFSPTSDQTVETQIDIDTVIVEIS